MGGVIVFSHEQPENPPADASRPRRRRLRLKPCTVPDGDGSPIGEACPHDTHDPGRAPPSTPDPECDREVIFGGMNSSGGCVTDTLQDIAG